MAEQKIQLRQLRDFGENFNDTFLFIRQNLRPLLKSFFAICSVFMVGLAIFYGIVQSHSFSLLQSVFRGRSSVSNNYSDTFSVEYFLYVIFLVLTFVSMEVVLGSYIKFYAENDGNKPTIDDIWTLFRRYFFKVFGITIIFWILIMIGVVFCIVPGVYFWVAFAPITMVIMMENRGLVATYERCIEIIKENFWKSFGIYFVAYLIFYISHGMIEVAGTVVLGLSAYFSTKDLSASLGMITSFLSIFSYCFYIVYFISIALNYFSLVEARDGTGLLNRIQDLGNRNTDLNKSEEQY